jgi:hypothetical protein
MMSWEIHGTMLSSMEFSHSVPIPVGDSLEQMATFVTVARAIEMMHG